jgi:hypothetical protein
MNLGQDALADLRCRGVDGLQDNAPELILGGEVELDMHDVEVQLRHRLAGLPGLVRARAALPRMSLGSPASIIASALNK